MIKSILKNKITNGDSLKELKIIPNETFDLIFADPPYNLQLKKELSLILNLKLLNTLEEVLFLKILFQKELKLQKIY